MSKIWFVIDVITFLVGRGNKPAGTIWAYWSNQTKLHGFNIKLQCNYFMRMKAFAEISSLNI